MTLPKCYLLYFKNMLDVAFIEFFDEYNDFFEKNDNGQYVLLKALDEGSLEKFFIKSIEKQLKDIVIPYDIINAPNSYFIIGSCNPRDNFLLRFRDNKYFPRKLNDMIFKSKFQLKYLLRENDIKIDMVKFNQACIGAFNHFFQNKSKFNNVIFISHKSLDCYSMFKALKFIIGRSNCINLYEQKFKDVKSPIIALNDLIDKYVHNKQEANKDIKFKRIINELKQFVSLTSNINIS